MHLDVQTLSVVTVFITALLGALLVFAGLQNRNIRAPMWWSAAHIVNACGLGLLTSQGAAPAFVTNDLANALVLLGYGLTWTGARVFDGRKVRPLYIFCAPAIWLTLCRIPAFAANASLETVVVSTMLAWPALRAAEEFWRGRDEHRHIVRDCDLVTALLGCFLLFAWMQDRIQALAWWGAAYLVGGFSGRLAAAPPALANVLLFDAVGLIWSAARLFHGRPVRWGAMCFGGVVWLAACLLPAFDGALGPHIILSSTIVATYTFLTAAELWRERRKSLLRRWPALFVPTLHGAIFLLPVALASLDLRHRSRTLRRRRCFHRARLGQGPHREPLQDRRRPDPLTGLLNRRGFFEAAAAMMKGNAPRREPVSCSHSISTTSSRSMTGSGTR